MTAGRAAIPDHGQAEVKFRVAASFADFLTFVRHPAWRLGVLDRLARRPLDHDDLERRILAETSPRALERVRWPRQPLDRAELEAAQVYYENGRDAVVHGLRLDEWPVLDHLPDPLVAWIHDRIRERRNL